MENNPNNTQRSRENILATSMGIFAGGIILFYLYIISLGIVGNVLAIGLGLVVVGAMHYLFWGRAFSEEVAAEREALRRQEARQEQRWSGVPADAIQDLSRTHGIEEDK